MAFSYMSIDAFSASETIVLFVLQELGTEHFYLEENYKRTPMRVNAHDTAAAMALVYDDTLLDHRTIEIYVVQAIPDTDQALFLRIFILPDMLSATERDALEYLGFYIGLDFLEYLALAPMSIEGEGDAEDEE